MVGTVGHGLIAGTEGTDSVRAAAGDDVIDARSGDNCCSETRARTSSTARAATTG